MRDEERETKRGGNRGTTNNSSGKIVLSKFLK
jgi:hypothetical protein